MPGICTDNYCGKLPRYSVKKKYLYIYTPNVIHVSSNFFTRWSSTTAI